MIYFRMIADDIYHRGDLIYYPVMTGYIYISISERDLTPVG